MSKIKNGLVTLGWYCLLAVIAGIIAGQVNSINARVVYILVMIISLVLWYEAMYRSLRQSLQNGVVTMLFFLLPSALISLWYYLLPAGRYLSRIVYLFFHGPFFYGLAPVMNMSSRPWLTILLPLIIILLLFLSLIIKYIAAENSWRRSPYIL